jgi:predicted nucleic acid-binding protein
VIAVDTSVVVAGFASWHEVLVESYSVLTRLPPPHRAPADLVAAFLSARFPQPPLVLPGRAQRELVRTAAASGLLGGAIYDALIAATARHAGATLLTRDQRARSIYERLAIRFEFVG